MAKKLFDFAIGNPPYQEEFSTDGNKTYAAPVYNEFMDAANEVADKVELIHPARFLFNAGSTPKAWNRKMLNDPHFKVLKYEEDATKVFPNTEIKGGVAISYHDSFNVYGPIGVFTKYEELNSIIKRVCSHHTFERFSKIAVTSYAYHFTDALHKDHPEVASQLSKGHAYDLKSNVFERIPQVFYDKDQGDDKYIKILGRVGNKRVYKFIRRKYINDVINLEKYKIFIPAANGNGVLGEAISSPILSEPNVGSTETFMSIGCFDNLNEAEAVLKYIKTKFARILLGVNKVTQHITPEKWIYVPLQNFGADSDIDWSTSVHEIDVQLYRKYKLSVEEINFIENTAKEMI